MSKGDCSPSSPIAKEVQVVDVSLIGVEELDVLIRSLTAIVKLAQRTKQKLENAGVQSGVSNRSGL